MKSQFLNILASILGLHLFTSVSTLRLRINIEKIGGTTGFNLIDYLLYAPTTLVYWVLFFGLFFAVVLGKWVTNKK